MHPSNLLCVSTRVLVLRHLLHFDSRLTPKAGEGARRAKDKVCRAMEMEAGVVEREAAVEVKWKEITTARRSLKQVGDPNTSFTSVEAGCTSGAC